MIILNQSETTHGTPFSSPTHTLSRPGLNFPKPLITCMLDLYRCIQIQSWKWVGSVCELMMMGVGLGLQFTSLEAWIKMDYGSHLRRYERKGLNMMKHIREKLLHPHHINKKWAQQLRSNWTENKIAHTGALSLPSLFILVTPSNEYFKVSCRFLFRTKSFRRVCVPSCHVKTVPTPAVTASCRATYSDKCEISSQGTNHKFK